MNIAVFASGYGSNFENIIKRIKNYTNLNLVLLVSDRKCRALDLAQAYGISNYLTKDTTELLSILKSKELSLILLAGYLSIIPKELIDAYPLRIINIHPSLLPKYKGLKAIKRIFEAGEKYSGVSIHYVNDGIDTGPIILQETLPVYGSFEEFELAVHNLEYDLYDKLIHLFASKRAIVISKCLLGVNCRYDGSNKLKQRLLKFIEQEMYADIFYICPEADAGMPVPREPIDEANALPYIVKQYIQKLLRILQKYDFIEFILKDKSPSCGTLLKEGAIYTAIRESKLFTDKKVVFITENDL